MSQALASLTATYTDSEGEDEEPPHANQGTVNLLLTPDENSGPSSSRTNSPRRKRIVKKLVSYRDETIASSDDDDDNVNQRRQSVSSEKSDSSDNTEDVNQDDTEDSNYQLIIQPQRKDIPATDHDDDDPNKSIGLDENVISDDLSALLPPEPQGQCAQEITEKIAKLYEKMNHQKLDMNALIQRRKDFRNPSIYEKLIQFCGINELGTNYPPALYDPLKWSKESYYEELAKVQKIEMDKREKDRKSKVEFLSGTVKKSGAAGGAANSDDELKRRKSKWDQPGAAPGPPPTNIKPAGLVQPTLTANATGTKGTVISAFGSLPKKPRL